MANTLGNFNVPLFAGKALSFLMNGLGTPRRVNRAYESERAAWNKGEVVNVRRPAPFTVYDAPIPAASVDDAVTESLQIVLDQYKEVKMKITDRELAFTDTIFIESHVAPMAYALANQIDRSLLALSYLIPHTQQIVGATANASVLTTADKIMRENRVPDDGPMRRHYAASPTVWQKWLDLAAFSQYQGFAAGGVTTQETATLSQKFGFMPYPSNNLLQVASQPTPVTAGALTVTGAYAKGQDILVLNAATSFTGTIKAGMVIQVGTTPSTGGAAYQAELYSVTTDASPSGPNASVLISPPLRNVVLNGTAWSFKVNAAAAAYSTELAFHTDAIALVMVPLPSEAMGARVQTATDENSGLSVRTRLFYDGNMSAHFFAMDVLFGVKVLNADMAVRGIVV